MLGAGQGARFRAPLSGTAGLAQAGTQEDTPANCVYVRRRDPVEHDSQHEREARAARNQALFRAVNEKLRDLNEQFASMTEEHVIACECADTNCTEVISITSEEFKAIGDVGNRFIVKSGHELPEVEDVVGRHRGFLVVAKRGAGGEYVHGHE